MDKQKYWNDLSMFDFHSQGSYLEIKAKGTVSYFH